jgi:cell division transport system ATP-binding protein
MNNSHAPTPSIVFDHVGLRYGRGDEILSDINLSLMSGSLNFITGPSGAGKTSLLKLVYLHMRPSRGLITLFGQDTSVLNIKSIPMLKRRMGVVLQDFQLVDHLSVFENVALPLRVRGIKRDHYAADVQSLLQWVGLGNRIDAFPSVLSGGEKQRVAIARSVIGKPDILIADEPTGNVDNVIGKRLMRLFSELNKQGTTILIATHNHDLIPDNADIYSLHHGHLRKELGEDNA